MKYLLYCRNDPVDLGIEDLQGNWDMEKLLKHIGRCRECSRFLSLIGLELLTGLVKAAKTHKGGQINDRPQILQAPDKAERRNR